MNKQTQTSTTTTNEIQYPLAATNATGESQVSQTGHNLYVNVGPHAPSLEGVVVYADVGGILHKNCRLRGSTADENIICNCYI